jgi:hypothetical protein
VRGYRALTADWPRPVMPELAPKVAAPKKRYRPMLLEPDACKVVSDLDAIAQKAQAEINRIFKEAGLTSKQQWQQMKLIRKGLG